MAEQENIKEQRIRKITHLYYSRKDIQKALFSFSSSREIVPRYFEGFGKRPDSFQYPGDIFELVKRGATSFHCSEEIWSDPLKLYAGMNEKQLNQLRVGWDLIVDIDCPWIEYSKKAALAIIKILEAHKIKNFGIKYSGSKGFHIIVPWKAFPKEIFGNRTSEMFPHWPKIIINYIKENSRTVLEESTRGEISDFKDMKEFMGIRCENCKNLATKTFQINLECTRHRPAYTEIFTSFSEKFPQKKCPHCNSALAETEKREYYSCGHCKINSLETPRNFKPTLSADIFKILGLDLQLVSSRHLFRMPYSLHEKTALASVVLRPEDIAKFQPKDADPLKVQVRDFLPDAKEGEAAELLREALDWNKTHGPKDESTERYDKEFKPLVLKDISEKNFPPSIQQILLGIKGDGRKRALFVIMNFLRAIGMERKDIEQVLDSWNKKNEIPLKEGYIKAQVFSSYKGKALPPPNYDKDYYRVLGITPTEEELRARNPVSYMVRKAFNRDGIEKSRKPQVNSEKARRKKAQE